jgi:hypothetical protein
VNTSRALAAYSSALIPLLLIGLAACSDDDVAAPRDEPGVAIATATPSLALVAGEQASITVRVTRRAGFAGPVTLGVTGAPAGITVALTPNPVAGDTAVLAIEAGDGVAAGAYPLAFSASGAGVRTATATLQLQVAAPSVTAVTIPFCDNLAPVWAAFQDGNGAWTRATLTSSGGRTTLRHEFTSARGAVAMVTPAFDGQFTVLRVLYGSPAELATEGDTLRAACEVADEKTWNGQVDGLGAQERALVSTGILRSGSVAPVAGNFVIPGVSPGLQDVLATRTRLADEVETITGFILRRDVEVPNEAQLPTFDFTSAEAFAPATATLTIAGAGADPVISVSELHTRNSRVAHPFLTRDPFATTRPYFGLPSFYLRNDDLQLLHIATSNAANGSSRTADVYFRTTVDRTLALGVPITAPTLSEEAGGTALRVRGLFGALADYDQSATLVLVQVGSGLIASVAATGSYSLAQGGGFDVAVPDLSTVAGFDGAWALRRGMNTQWAAIRTGGTVPIGRNAVATDGAVRRTAIVQGTIAVP